MTLRASCTAPWQRLPPPLPRGPPAQAPRVGRVQHKPPAPLLRDAARARRPAQAALQAMAGGAEGAAAAATSAAAAPAPPVAVVTTLGCPHCKRAKAALEAAGIPFAEYQLAEQLEVLAAIKAATGLSTVPQVFVGGRLLGGADDVMGQLESGALQRLLAATTAPPLPQELQALLQRAAAAAATAQQGAAAAAAEAEGSERAQQKAPAAELGAAVAMGSSKTFTLQQAAQWLQRSKGMPAEAAAAALGRLQAAQLLALADAAPGSTADQALTAQLMQQRPQLLLRLTSDAPAPTRWSQPLNGQFAWFGPARPAEQVAEGLRQAIVRLYDKYLSADGKKVDYRGLRADPGWAEFVAASAELQKVDLAGLASREQRMAFFLNTYNALIVHALVVFGAADGTLSRLRWFDSVSYLIGGARFSSNDIEHGVLRGNRPSPAALFSLLGRPDWAGPIFRAGDPRAALAVQPMDPRIHFALNCGAASCPPIRVYTPERLDVGLEAAAQAFCAGEVAVDKAARRVESSMIFKWYGGDFGSQAQLLEFIAAHLPPGPAADLRELLASGPVVLSYRPYDWSTNSQD